MIISKQRAKDLGLSPTIIVDKKELRNKAIHLWFSELIVLAIRSLFIKK